MDLIYTNGNRVDQGVLTAYAFDLSFGAEENDFEMTLGADEAGLEYGAFIYMEGTEYGGIVDGVKASTNGETITYMGRTWHGILNSKVIQPDSGKDYLVLTGDANDILSVLIARLGLESLFSVASEKAGITISNHQFERYCKGYDGIKAMLAKHGAKLKISWQDRNVHLSAVPIVDYTQDPVDGDMALLSVEFYAKKVNHLICLGQGDLADREVLHLYVNQFGQIGDVKYFTGLDEIVDVYDNNGADSTGKLREEGIKHFNELLDIDKADIAIHEDEQLIYDIGDIVGASELKSGITVAAPVSQKIVKISNGAISTEYKTGG